MNSLNRLTLLTMDQNGNTPLLYAATKGDFDMLTLLLEKGANPIVKNKAGETALHFACSHGHLGIVGTLLTLTDVESLTIGRQPPLYYAARHNKLDIVKYLLDHRPIANYSIPLVSFQSPLVIGLLNGRFHIDWSAYCDCGD